MPYRSGLIQAALGAVSAVAFLIANSASPGDSKEKRLTGTLKKAGSESILLTEDNSHQHTLELGENATIFLNDRTVPIDAMENGRKATVRYYKKKGKLIATNVDLFPSHTDFDPAPGSSEEANPS